MARYAKPERGNTANSNTRVSASGSAAFEVVLDHVNGNGAQGKLKKKGSPGVDAIDMQVIPLMLAGYSTIEISTKLRIPLSTIQRRTKNLISSGYVVPVVHLNFKKFGLRRGLLQFKCKSANLKEAVQKVSAIRGVESVGGYLGSLDLIANVVYSDSSEVLGMIAEAQKLDLISDVTWSEEIHSMPI